MSDQKILELIITLSVVFLAVGVLVFWLKMVFRDRREEVAKRFRRKKILRQFDMANFYGLESLGRAQARGNGVLVLTQEELYFLKALPRRETVIPVSAITAVSNRRSHLGKSNLVKLLRVEFENSGKPDAVAFAVDDIDAWTREVEQVRAKVSA